MCFVCMHVDYVLFSHVPPTRRLQSLEALELETRNEMEQQNMEMNEEIRKLKSVLSRCIRSVDFFMLTFDLIFKVGLQNCRLLKPLS